jgi:hypothetical protein
MRCGWTRIFLYGTSNTLEAYCYLRCNIMLLTQLITRAQLDEFYCSFIIRGSIFTLGILENHR